MLNSRIEDGHRPRLQTALSGKIERPTYHVPRPILDILPVFILAAQFDDNSQWNSCSPLRRSRRQS